MDRHHLVYCVSVLCVAADSGQWILRTLIVGLGVTLLLLFRLHAAVAACSSGIVEDGDESDISQDESHQEVKGGQPLGLAVSDGVSPLAPQTQVLERGAQGNEKTQQHPNVTKVDDEVVVHPHKKHRHDIGELVDLRLEEVADNTVARTNRSNRKIQQIFQENKEQTKARHNFQLSKTQEEHGFTLQPARESNHSEETLNRQQRQVCQIRTRRPPTPGPRTPQVQSQKRKTPCVGINETRDGQKALTQPIKQTPSPNCTESPSRQQSSKAPSSVPFRSFGVFSLPSRAPDTTRGDVRTGILRNDNTQAVPTTQTKRARIHPEVVCPPGKSGWGLLGDRWELPTNRNKAANNGTHKRGAAKNETTNQRNNNNKKRKRHDGNDQIETRFERRAVDTRFNRRTTIRTPATNRPTSTGGAPEPVDISEVDISLPNHSLVRSPSWHFEITTEGAVVETTSVEEQRQQPQQPARKIHSEYKAAEAKVKQFLRANAQPVFAGLPPNREPNCDAYLNAARYLAAKGMEIPKDVMECLGRTIELRQELFNFYNDQDRGHRYYLSMWRECARVFGPDVEERPKKRQRVPEARTLLPFMPRSFLVQVQAE